MCATKRWLILYSILWIGIGLMSAYDAFWLVKNREFISSIEKNPLGLWLIELDDGDVSIFVSLKLAGTMLALGILALLYRYKRRWAWVCVVSVFIVQVFVIWYVIYGGVEDVLMS
tara:strand:- start:2142 stop:2486 length:345 start_codon:yes stop_codon:yes gene_type:complete